MRIPSLDTQKRGGSLENSPSILATDQSENHRATGVRGPRSKIVESILLLLYSRPMKSCEIAKRLGKPSRYISSYLSYWKSRGLVDYRAGYWFLTKEGEEYVKMLVASMRLSAEEQLSHKKMSDLVNQTMNSNDRRKEAKSSGSPQSFIVEQTGTIGGEDTHNRVARALRCLNDVMSNRDLDEEEYAVLQHLVKHYAEWGSTYRYIDQIAESLRYEPKQLLIVLRKLQTKKLIYMYSDRRFGLRVGLGKGLKQLIDKCLSTE